MSSLNPGKLHIDLMESVSPDQLVLPRAYTLTHSDRTGELFLTIADQYNLSQISGWYTRLLRDEVLACWKSPDGTPSLHVHCRVSGGIIFGPAGWRESIFRYHMPMVLEAFRYGDHQLFDAHPELDEAQIWVHFHRARRQESVEAWGCLKDFRLET
jgi:hypothetical protein